MRRADLAGQIIAKRIIRDRKVTAVGRPRATSATKLGPDKTAICGHGKFRCESDINLRLSRSMPLAHKTSTAFLLAAPAEPEPGEQIAPVLP